MALSFEVLATDPAGRARLGRATTDHGAFDTPAFMPVGTKASVKGMTPEDLRAAGARSSSRTRSTSRSGPARTFSMTQRAKDRIADVCHWFLCGEILLAPVVFTSRRIVVSGRFGHVEQQLRVFGLPIRTRVGDFDPSAAVEVRSLEDVGAWMRWWLGLLLGALSPLGVSSLFERFASRWSEGAGRAVEIVVLDGRRRELARIATWDLEGARAIARQIEAVLAAGREPEGPNS